MIKSPSIEIINVSFYRHFLCSFLLLPLTHQPFFSHTLSSLRVFDQKKNNLLTIFLFFLLLIDFHSVVILDRKWEWVISATNLNSNHSLAYVKRLNEQTYTAINKKTIVFITFVEYTEREREREKKVYIRNHIWWK